MLPAETGRRLLGECPQAEWVRGSSVTQPPWVFQHCLSPLEWLQVLGPPQLTVSSLYLLSMPRIGLRVASVTPIPPLLCQPSLIHGPAQPWFFPSPRNSEACSAPFSMLLPTGLYGAVLSIVSLSSDVRVHLTVLVLKGLFSGSW